MCGAQALRWGGARSCSGVVNQAAEAPRRVRAWASSCRALRLMDGPDEVHLRTVARHELAQARAGLGASAAWFTTPEQLRAPPHLSA